MTSRIKHFNFNLVFALAALVFVALLGGACASATAERAVAPAAAETADADLRAAQALVEKLPASTKGYVELAAVYIKKARATGDFSLNAKAERSVAKALEIAPGDVPARKLQASLHLTFHRFAEALALGEELRREYPDDAFVDGVLTDAYVELGRYEEAVAAAQRMIDRRPNTASYARVAHLRALHGDAPGALEMYRAAARAADPLDKEARSWCLVQLGDELWRGGRYGEAEKAYDEALAVLPGYHLALAGRGRARAAQNDFAGAIALLREANDRVPQTESLITLGDLYERTGDAEKARVQYELVEAIESRLGANNDQKRLALLWADQTVRLDEALAIVEREAGLRRDIYTLDALAWTHYRRGELAAAKKASDEALRLGTQDARLFYHAGMIAKDAGDRRAAKKHLAAALRLNPMFDLRQAEAARQALREVQ